MQTLAEQAEQVRTTECLEAYGADPRNMAGRVKLAIVTRELQDGKPLVTAIETSDGSRDVCLRTVSL